MTNKYLEKIAANAKQQANAWRKDNKGSYQKRYSDFVKNPESKIHSLSTSDKEKVLKSQKFWRDHSTNPETVSLVKRRGTAAGAFVGAVGGGVAASKLAKSKAGMAATILGSTAAGAVGGRHLLPKRVEKTIPRFDKRISMLEKSLKK